MMKKIVQNYWEVFVIFLLSLTPLLWMRQGEIVLGHDSGFRLDPLNYLEQIWYSWSPLAGKGVDLSNYKGFLIGQLPETIFSRLTGSLATGQTVSFVFWFYVMGISMYVLVKSFFPEKKYWQFRLTASTFYIYNFFLLQGWFITERAKFSLFAALPLAIVCFWKTLDRKYELSKGSILFGLIFLVFNGGGSPPLYGGILVSLTVLTLFFLSRAILNKSIKNIFLVLKTIFTFVIVTILFNAYWFFPQIYVGVTQYSSKLSAMGGFNGILSWENYVSRFASFINLLRLQGIPDWYENPLHTYAHYYISNPLFIVASFIPIVSILFVLFRPNLWKQYWEYREIFFTMLLLLLIGMMMTAGSHPPLGFIYVALLRHVPGFLIFRTAFYKFGSALWLPAIILSSFAFYVLTTGYVRNRLIYIAVSTLLLLGILGYHFPYFKGNFFLWNKPFSTKVALPGYVREMFFYINTHYENKHSAIMLLPPLDSSFHADSYRWGFYSLDTLPKLGLHVPVVANDVDSPMINALYNAAISHNSNLFSQLAKRFGIDKVLWRGDVLYADKTTTSDNFGFMQDMLLQTPGISKEKVSGEWTLYSLGNLSLPKDLIRAESSMYLANIDDPKLSQVFGGIALDDKAVVLSGSLHNLELEGKINQFLIGNILTATCMFCDASELEQIENMPIVPNARFLPDSPVYLYMRSKETSLLTSLEASPGQRIDADLAFATKRLSEVWSLVNRNIKDNTENLALFSFADFKERINDAKNETFRLNEIDKNKYKGRIGAYLKFYTRYLAVIDRNDRLPRDFISSVYEYLLTEIQSISEDLWITNTPAMEKYYLTIPTDDVYELDILSDKGNPVPLKIDDQAVLDTSALHLKKGIHKLALDYAVRNEIVSSSGVNLDNILPYGQESISFDIPKLLYWDKYALHFDYRVNNRKGIYAVIHQNNDSKDAIGNIKRALVVPLQEDGLWHHVNFFIQPNFGATKADLVFYTTNPWDEQGSLSISQPVMQNISSGSVFAVKHNLMPVQEMPKVSYQTLNPAIYTSTVSAPRPFIFRFGQAFDEGWKAFIMPKGTGVIFRNPWELFSLVLRKSVDSKEHFALDGLDNAWFFDKTGEYDIVLVFWPYIIFLFSSLCSFISIVVSLFIYKVKYLRK